VYLLVYIESQLHESTKLVNQIAAISLVFMKSRFKNVETMTVRHGRGAFAKFRKATINFLISFRLLVCPSERENSAPTGWIFMKIDFWGVFFTKIFREISSFIKIMKRIMGTLYEDIFTFRIGLISHWILLQM
jgi:hypothetical protein